VGAAPPRRVRVSADAEPGTTSGEQPSTKLARSLPDELLEIAVEVARMGGALLAERFHRGHEQAVASKSSPTDLVSEADIDVERKIRETIEIRRPHDGFMGEESGEQPGSSRLRWVVDPLDGTVNFLFAIPQWCVSVAVRDDDGPLAGAIYDPIRDELFTATRDGPATLDMPKQERLRDSTPDSTPSAPARELRTLAVTQRGDLSTAMIATGLAYDADVRAAQGEVLARLVGRVRDIRRFGSAALDLAWTAAGRYDAYFERSVKPWDIEAGTLICERAGLNVIELPERERLPYGVLAAVPGIAEPLLELVR
jgi:myo-inositol-1(or 4)-monophosphatase